MDVREAEQIFFREENVSRETLERLRLYEELLVKWNAVVNLVSRSTIASIWERHFLDSAVIYRHRPTGMIHWVDIGSGGGFPGMVLAILDAEKKTKSRFTLIEANRRKCEFLRRVAAVTGIEVEIRNMRAEQLEPLAGDVVTARACAALEQLLSWAFRHLAPDGCCLFLKGAGYREEVAAASRTWSFDSRIHATGNGQALLAISDLRRE